MSVVDETAAGSQARGADGFGEAARACTAEALGTAFLLMGIIGSGIMASDSLGATTPLAILINALAITGILTVIIMAFAPISGAHFNPAVTLVMAVRGAITPGRAVLFVGVQILAAIAGVVLCHVMFELEPLIQVSDTARPGLGRLVGEGVATFGLIGTILAVSRLGSVPVTAGAVGLYIGSAIWFTSSTSFANPAVTLARMITDTFTGIAPADVLPFIGVQLVGALVAGVVFSWLLQDEAAS